MEKYMKFPMYEETKDKKYRDDPYRSVNFRVNEAGRLVCPKGTYGEIKANRGYERFRRRGINKVILEIALISCGFNLHKYHLSKLAKANPAKAAG